MRYLKQSNSQKQRVECWFPGPRERGKWGSCYSTCIVSVLRDEYVLKICCTTLGQQLIILYWTLTNLESRSHVKCSYHNKIKIKGTKQKRKYKERNIVKKNVFTEIRKYRLHPSSRNRLLQKKNIQQTIKCNSRIENSVETNIRR